MENWVPYCGIAPEPADIWMRWNLDPVLLMVFGAAALAVVWHSRKGGRSGFLWTALALLAVLFISPLCALSSALFSARVFHHTALVAVVAPLLAFTPAVPLLLPRGVLITAGFMAQLVTLWFWHAPAPYAAAMADETVYWMMQFSLLGSAVAFWQGVRLDGRSLRAAIYLLGTAVHMGLLGALITFAGEPLYAPHLLTTLAWNLTALEDQQLAGLIMWVPAALPYLAAVMMLGASWLRDPQIHAGVPRA